MNCFSLCSRFLHQLTRIRETLTLWVFFPETNRHIVDKNVSNSIPIELYSRHMYTFLRKRMSLSKLRLTWDSFDYVISDFGDLSRRSLGWCSIRILYIQTTPERMKNNWLIVFSLFGCHINWWNMVICTSKENWYPPCPPSKDSCSSCTFFLNVCLVYIIESFDY